MTGAVAVPGSSWIVGPRYDLFFFSTIWLLPLFVVAPLGSAGVGLGIGFFYIWIYHLLIRFPHFAAMFHATYFRPEQRAHFRKHWVRYFAIPAAILAIYALPLVTGIGFDSRVGSALAMVAYVWGYQHIGMQNYGILQVYRMRSGGRAGAPRYEKAIFYSIIVAVALRNQVLPFLRVGNTEVFGVTAKVAVGVGLAGVLVALIAAYLLHLWRARALSGPAVVYFGVAVAAMVQWPFYDRLPQGSWFLVFNGHHSVAYLGLLFLMSWNRRSPGESMTFDRGFKEYLRFFGPLLVFSLGLVFVAAAYTTAKIAIGYTEEGGSLEVLLGFFVMHYYVESLVWHFREPHNRATTLPLLRPPGT